MKLITFAVPCYNSAAYMDHCIQTLLTAGEEAEIIPLNGSIELAPIIGLSDVIVDIVETGTTLRENDLRVLHAARRYIDKKDAHNGSPDSI